MKTRMICLLIDVKRKECINGKSYLSQVKEAFMPAIIKIEPGDCLMIFDEGIAAYDEPGQCISAIQSYTEHHFNVPKTLRDAFNLVHNLDINEDVFVFVITDSFTYDAEYAYGRVLRAEPALNKFAKKCKIFIWGVGCDKNIIHLEKYNDHCDCRLFKDPSFISHDLISETIFKEELVVIVEQLVKSS